jgi:hypothetical protein
MVPVWLLDVDGVINVTRPGWSAPPHRAHTYAGGVEWRIRWAPALVDRIRAFHTSGMVEVRWCSTWCPQAGQLERLFHLPTLGCALDVNPVPPSPENWVLKLNAAWAVLAECRALIWTDDDAIPGEGPARDELEATGRALLIAPKSNRGLQPEDLNAIEEFARAHAGEAKPCASS